MKRLFPRLAIFSTVTLLSAAFLSGCTSDPVSLTVRDFATIRVLNFTQSDMASASCAVPIDVYINRADQQPDTLAVANGLAYGQASVYANNLPADAGGTQYNIIARPIHSKDKSFKTQMVTVLPGHRYSWILYSPASDPTNYTSQLVEDANMPADTNVTYVRFINVQEGNALTMHVNDPVTSTDTIYGIPYQSASAYKPLKYKQDSAYTFYVTIKDDQRIVSRLGFQTFAPGSFHTVVYGGDLCRVAPHDTTGNPADSLRIRVYDDNTIGNDQTFPIPLTFRYNIVNALLGTVTQYDKIGYLVNNEGVPQYNNLTFLPVPKFGVAPGYSTTDDGVLEAPYANSIITDAVDIKAFGINNDGSTGPQLFDIHAARKVPATGKPSINSDLPASIIIFDTISNGKILDSSKVKQVVIPLPDQSYSDSVRIVIVNALVREKGVAVAKLNASFKVNGVPDAPLSTGSGAAPGRFDVFDYSLTSPGTCTISTAIPGGSNVPGDRTFKVVPGGIYEVVLAGSKDAAQFIVIHLNPLH